jgi:spore coat protein U-like protein
MRKIHLFLLALTSCLYTSSNSAGTITTTFGVSATVINQCLVSATNLAFGNYDPTSNIDTTSTNTLSVTCTLSDSYTIALNGGTTSGGTIAQRLMTDGSNTINYNIYQNSAHTTLWGDGATGTTEAGTGTGIVQTYTAYGIVPKQQVIPTGTYTDTITVTLNF